MIRLVESYEQDTDHGRHRFLAVVDGASHPVSEGEAKSMLAFLERALRHRPGSRKANARRPKVNRVRF